MTEWPPPPRRHDPTGRAERPQGRFVRVWPKCAERSDVSVARLQVGLAHEVAIDGARRLVDPPRSPRPRATARDAVAGRRRRPARWSRSLADSAATLPSWVEPHAQRLQQSRRGRGARSPWRAAPDLPGSRTRTARDLLRRPAALGVRRTPADARRRGASPRRPFEPRSASSSPPNSRSPPSVVGARGAEHERPHAATGSRRRRSSGGRSSSSSGRAPTRRPGDATCRRSPNRCRRRRGSTTCLPVARISSRRLDRGLRRRAGSAGSGSPWRSGRRPARARDRQVARRLGARPPARSRRTRAAARGGEVDADVDAGLEDHALLRASARRGGRSRHFSSLKSGMP